MSIEEIEKDPSDIEMMEIYYKSYVNQKDPEPLGFRDSMIENFMIANIDLHKDHIEKIAKLEKMLSERIKSDDEELINNEGDYVYEPNE
jgi:hypothetical protein